MKTHLSKRIKLLQKKLQNQKIEGLYLSDPFNIRYLSDFSGTNGQIFITPRKAYFLTDFRYLGVAKKILPPEVELKIYKKGLLNTLESLLNKHGITEMSFESQNLTYNFFNAFKKNLKIKLKPTTKIVEELREIKDEEEIAKIIKAQAIAEKVLLEVKKNLKPGKTEKDISWEIEKSGHEFGADKISFDSIIGFQENSANPHHQNTDKKLKKGDVVLIDMGMQYQGYCSDMTRMIFTAKPTAKQKEVYLTVLEAQEKSIQKMKAGVFAKDMDKIARDIIKKAGYGKTFGHSLGHGIGLEVHESPNLSPSSENALAENTIVTSEPGIYLEKNFGVRIEDMLLIKGDKALNLTKIPKKLEDSIWPIS